MNAIALVHITHCALFSHPVVNVNTFMPKSSSHKESMLGPEYFKNAAERRGDGHF